MSNLRSEPRLSPTALAKREGVHLSTCWRWILRGCKGHVLESFLHGGKRYTTVPAFERWLAKINGAKVSPSEPSRDRETAIEKAERDLEEILRKKRKDSGNENPPPATPQ